MTCWKSFIDLFSVLIIYDVTNHWYIIVKIRLVSEELNATVCSGMCFFSSKNACKRCLPSRIIKLFSSSSQSNILPSLLVHFFVFHVFTSWYDHFFPSNLHDFIALSLWKKLLLQSTERRLGSSIVYREINSSTLLPKT